MRQTSRAARSGTTRQPDAIELLKSDHQEVEALLDEFKTLAEGDADVGEKAMVAAQICAALTVHARLEEEIFYPAVREAIDEPLLMDEAAVEHESAKDLIAQIESMEIDEPLFDAKVLVLGEYVKHHVQEEENEMFPKVRKGKLDLEELGLRLQERKQALETEIMPMMAESP